MLEESITYATDHSSVTVTLRQGLRWSDGEVLGLEDVLFSVSEIYQSTAVETSTELKVNASDSLKNIESNYIHPFSGYEWESLVSRLYFD